MTQVQAEIQRHLKDAATYSGQRCTLRITLAPDGMPVGVRTEGGDPDLCRAAMQAVADARLPAANARGPKCVPNYHVGISPSVNKQRYPGQGRDFYCLHPALMGENH